MREVSSSIAWDNLLLFSVTVQVQWDSSDSLGEISTPKYLMLLVQSCNHVFWAADSQASWESGSIVDLVQFIV